MALYTPDPTTPQAQLPRFNAPPVYVTADQLAALQTDLNSGANYRINDGVFQVLNTDQNEYTPIYTNGADGAQTLELQDAVA